MPDKALNAIELILTIYYFLQDDAFDSRSGADGCHRLLLSSSSTASPMATTPVQVITTAKDRHIFNLKVLITFPEIT